MNPIREEIAYPSTDNLSVDCNAAAVIAPAYASPMGSEFGAVSQYIYHMLQFRHQKMPEYGDLMEGIAITEMKHMALLGEALLSLGVDPVMTACPPRRCNFFNTSCVSFSCTPQKMLLDDISAEMGAIEEYRRMLCRLENEQVAALIQRIVMDEQLHVKILKDSLDRLINTQM